MITLEAWLKEFNKLTVEYINSINWNTVIFNDGDIEQIGDDLQKEAFQNLNENIDHFVISNTVISTEFAIQDIRKH